MARMRTRSTHYAQRKKSNARDAVRNPVGRKRGQSLGAVHPIRCGTVPIFAGHAALLCLVLVMSTAGCGTACRCCRSETVSIATAPERVQVDGREYTLSASAWRDFQPIAPPDGQPLIVVVKVSPTDAQPLPGGLAIDRVWVVHGKDRWSVKPEPASLRGVTTPTDLETAVRGGPKWGPGIKVDVVARLRQGKKTYLVKATGIEIKRTD